MAQRYKCTSDNCPKYGNQGGFTTFNETLTNCGECKSPLEKVEHTPNN